MKKVISEKRISIKRGMKSLLVRRLNESTRGLNVTIEAIEYDQKNNGYLGAAAGVALSLLTGGLLVLYYYERMLTPVTENVICGEAPETFYSIGTQRAYTHIDEVVVKEYVAKKYVCK